MAKPELRHKVVINSENTNVYLLYLTVLRTNFCPFCNRQATERSPKVFSAGWSAGKGQVGEHFLDRTGQAD